MTQYIIQGAIDLFHDQHPGYNKFKLIKLVISSISQLFSCDDEQSGE